MLVVEISDGLQLPQHMRTTQLIATHIGQGVIRRERIMHQRTRHLR
jgi:hypothetical protein